MATVTSDLGAGDCLLDHCGPVLLWFTARSNIRCLGRPGMKKKLGPFSGPFSVRSVF